MKLTKIIDTKAENMLLRDYLKTELELSRRTIVSLTKVQGTLLVNKMPITLRYTLQLGDCLTINFPPEVRGNSLTPENIPLKIVYEDEQILVVDKPANMVTVPSQIHRFGTLANALLGYYDQKGIHSTVHIVTRLDRDTSGLVLIAKHKHIHSLLAKQQENQTISRKYLAVVQGNMPLKQGRISARIGRAEDSIIKRRVHELGQKAITHYRTLKETEEFTLVEIVLETGRTHQIRVHFSSIGFPLAGDDLYGGTKAKINRQALHCYELSFDHPITKQALYFTSKTPNEFECLLNAKIYV